MDIKKILAACDHTVLDPAATWENIKGACEDAVKYNTASVCIPPYFVRLARQSYDKNDLKICTVIGFPHGNMTKEAKVYEAMDALRNGADELDMVINISALKDGDYEYIADEISEIRSVCYDRILKVIIETCLLTDEEKIKMCDIVTNAGADFIKTSTGFSTGGATIDDVKLLAKNIGNNVKVKASGGIASLEDAEKFLEAGASRLGTSRVIRIIKER